VGHEEIDAAMAWHSVLEREVQLMETWERAVCVVWSWKSPVDSMSGNSNANGISSRNRSTSNYSCSSCTSSSDTSDTSDTSDSDSGSESASSRSSQQSRDSRSALSEIFSKLRCHAWSSEDEEKRCRKLGRWSEQEEALLQQIGKRSIALLSEDEQHQSLITILNILFALCYDLRLQGGEPSPVAAWHLNVLAGSLAGLLTWDRVDAMCQNAHRRSLIYPYLTAWRLSQQVWQDVKCIAYLGRTTMLKYLLMAREICEADEQRKIFCLLFLDDLISFLQQVTFAQLAALWDEIQHVRIEPSHVGLNLDMWHELAASMSRQDLQDADI
jgi:hypothetical protein